MSRPASRIPHILKQIEEYWLAHPDLRLAQIVGNAWNGDPYFMEDDHLSRRLEEWLSEDRVNGVSRRPGPTLAMKRDEGGAE